MPGAVMGPGAVCASEGGNEASLATYDPVASVL